MSRESQARFVVIKAFEKIIKGAVKDATADMKAELLEAAEATGADRVKVDIGSESVKVTLVTPKAKPVGYGIEFLDFMRDKGMTIENVMPQWAEMVEPLGDGSRIVWIETGEVVPGGYMEQPASYPKITSLNAESVLNNAKNMGLLDAIPMLEGGTDEVQQ